MISFTIPTSHLRLFLIALDMNWDTPEPDYIFHVENTFQIVYTKKIDQERVKLIDAFVAGIINR